MKFRDREQTDYKYTKLIFYSTIYNEISQYYKMVRQQASCC